MSSKIPAPWASSDYFKKEEHTENVVFPNTIFTLQDWSYHCIRKPSKEMESDNDLLCMGIMLSFVLNIRISGS